MLYDRRGNIMFPNYDLKSNPNLVTNLLKLGLTPQQLVQISALNFKDIGFLIFPDHIEFMEGKVVDLMNTKEKKAKRLLWLKQLRERVNKTPFVKTLIDQFSKEIDSLVEQYAKEHDLEKSHQHFVLKRLAEIETDPSQALYYKELYESSSASDITLVAPLSEQKGIMTYVGIVGADMGILSIPPKELTLFQKVAGQILFKSAEGNPGAIASVTFSKTVDELDSSFLKKKFDFLGPNISSNHVK